ncbi:hypothetical protein VSDG_03742 [Cytospora chrysosperma]|uniref:Mitochondrial cytochrome c oxidase assembly factor n=1 Tax=Cytospora chrysosperma TaxID=252740 RepID=A0A423W6D0_CYTCH|nr:hypothetical protein VSDG_03742 [Valsa sordida]
MAGFNLELFKFGMYLFFPIAFMGYFGTNLDERFAVPDFWPKPEQANTVPTERDEIKAELERLRARRLYLRNKRLAEEGPQQAEDPAPSPAQEQIQEQPLQGQKRSWFW